MGNQNSTIYSVYSAARYGHAFRIQTVLSQETDAEQRQRMLEWADSKGRTPLIIASQKGYLGCVLELLRCGANIHHMGTRDFGGTALHEACYYKWRSNGIVEALLRHGANPFVKNCNNRTVLHLALIENATSHLYIPWILTFDRYGFFAEELMVMTSSLTTHPTWVSRWITIVPEYATSDPDHMRSLRNIMIIYDDYSTRNVISTLDLTNSRAEWTSEAYVELTLGRFHLQPLGVTSSKNETCAWTVSFNTTYSDGNGRLNDFITAINEEVPTIMERQLHDSSRRRSANCTLVDQETQDATQTRPSVVVENKDGNLTSSAPSEEPNKVLEVGDGVCVVCLDRPQTAGFLHGDSVHRCVCHACAYLVFLSERSQCPICRRKIERVVSEIH